MKICFDRSTLFTMDPGGGAGGGAGTWYARVSGLWNTMTTSLRLHTSGGGVATDQGGGATDKRGVSTMQRGGVMSKKGGAMMQRGSATLGRGGAYEGKGGAKDFKQTNSNGGRSPQGDWQPGRGQEGAKVGHGDLDPEDYGEQWEDVFINPLERLVTAQGDWQPGRGQEGAKVGHGDLDPEDYGEQWEDVFINPLERLVTAQYIGSFPVVGDDQNERAEYVRNQLSEMREVTRTKPVLLVISLSGIKVCSSSGESVYMAHALKRISYATCDPENRQFSFLAREPKGHTTVQYCHAFITATADQAEELNNIVGNAFKMAYAYQRQAEQAQQPTFHELIEQQLEEQRTRLEQVEEKRQKALQQKLKEISTATIADRVRERKERRRIEIEELERERAQARLQGKDRVNWAKHAVGKNKHKAPFSDEYQRHSMYASASPSKQDGGSGLSQSSASISMSALREAFEANDLRSHGSPVMALKETIDSHFNGSTVAGTDVTDGDAYLCPVVSSEPHPADDDNESPRHGNNGNMVNRPLPATPSSTDDKKPKKDKNTKGRKSAEARRSLVLNTRHEDDATRHEDILRNSNGHNNITTIRPPSVRYQNEASPPPVGIDVAGVYAISMTTPRKYDSLRKLDGSGPLEDEETLKQHTWYQAGIPREIALEILIQQEIGSFIVRDSTTHSGCFALSVKVPKFENPAGISHYLIHRTRNGVKLKGLDKEWPCLTALVTHHTVMPEMLPCTLRLPRNAANPAFNETEREDREEDEDYQKLSDFSTMMAELKKL